MSGIAELLINLGFEVSGSDLRESETTRKLQGMGARIFVGHEAGNAADADVVVYSSAVTATNPELVAAKADLVPVIPRAEMLAELMRLKYAITVGGAHGKTSTTSIIASVLAEGGLDPTVIVGGKLKAIGSNARLGDSRYVVAEADESDGTFVQLPSSVAVITNIDLEHMDHYADLEAIKDAFVEYAGRVPFYGSVVACVDDENVRSVLPRIRPRKVTYALHEEADLTGSVIERDERGCLFSVHHMNKELGQIRIAAPGDHFVSNSLAAVAVGLDLDIDFKDIKKGIEAFEGVGRRFEIKGTANDVMVVDDYGHHPTEIAATVKGALQNYDRRVIVFFQPHRYSRTQALAQDFGSCFEGAHTVFVTDIYAAGEEPIPDVSSALIVDAVRAAGTTVEAVSTFDDLLDRAANVVEPGDLVITFGAGNIYQAGERLLDRLEQDD